MKKLLFLASLFALASCKKEAEIEPPAEPLSVPFAHAEVITHPKFPEIMRMPEVVKATNLNRDATRLYDKVMYTHPQIIPIVEEMNALPPADPKRTELAERIKEISGLIPELREQKEKMDSTMLALIAQYGKAFETLDGGEEIAKKIALSLSTHEAKQQQ